MSKGSPLFYWVVDMEKLVFYYGLREGGKYVHVGYAYVGQTRGVFKAHRRFPGAEIVVLYEPDEVLDSITFQRTTVAMVREFMSEEHTALSIAYVPPVSKLQERVVTLQTLPGVEEKTNAKQAQVLRVRVRRRPARFVSQHTAADVNGFVKWVATPFGWEHQKVSSI